MALIPAEKVPWRIVMIVYSTLVASLVWGCVQVMNFTIISMVPPTANTTSIDSGAFRNDSITAPSVSSNLLLAADFNSSAKPPSNIPVFNWSKTQQSTALGAFAWGALASVMLESFLMQKIGARVVFFTVALITGVVTVLIPFTAQFNYWLFVVCRILQGLGYSSVMPMLAAVTANWASLKENGLFMGIGSAAIQISPVIAMPVAGMFCTSSAGWPGAFYWFGSVTIALVIFWFFLFRDQPSAHFWVSKRELEWIQRGKNLEGRGQLPPIPWRKIFTSTAVLACFVATIGNMWGIQMMIYFTPTFLKQMMGFEMRSIGFLSALPTLIQAIVKVIAGTASDKISLCGPCKNSESAKVRIFNSIAFVGMASFILALTSLHSPDQKVNAMLFLTGAVAILGFNTGGFFKSTTLVAQQYASLVVGMAQMITITVLLVLPYIVNSITKHSTYEEWRIVFYIAAAVLVSANLFFAAFGRGEPEPWAIPKKQAEPVEICVQEKPDSTMKS